MLPPCAEASWEVADSSVPLASTENTANENSTSSLVLEIGERFTYTGNKVYELKNSPLADSQTLSTIEADTVIEIIEFTDANWIKVKANDTLGYCSLDILFDCK